MKASIFAGVAGLAASAYAYGNAVIVSYCTEDVWIAAVGSEIAPNASVPLVKGVPFTQEYTALPDGCGWSLKFGPDESLPSDNIMQYEYTLAGATVWYDMSFVNSEGATIYSWEFESSDTTTCNPNNSNAFSDPTSPNGMQTDCPSDVTLTLHICTENKPSSGSASSAVASGAASTVAASSVASSKAATSAASSVVAPASSSVATSVSTPSSVSSVPASSAAAATSSPTTLATQTSRSHHWSSYKQALAVNTPAVSSAVTTSTPVTTSSVVAETSVAPDGAVVVTEVEYDYVTEVQTTFVAARSAAPHAAHRRHEHGHPHARRA